MILPEGIAFRRYLSRGCTPLTVPHPGRYNDGSFLPQSGPVAQLGARVNGIHEVTGSIPVWSTIVKSLTLNG